MIFDKKGINLRTTSFSFKHSSIDIEKLENRTNNWFKLVKDVWWIFDFSESKKKTFKQIKDTPVFKEFYTLFETDNIKCGYVFFDIGNEQILSIRLKDNNYVVISYDDFIKIVIESKIQEPDVFLSDSEKENSIKSKRVLAEWLEKKLNSILSYRVPVNTVIQTKKQFELSVVCKEKKIGLVYAYSNPPFLEPIVSDGFRIYVFINSFGDNVNKTFMEIQAFQGFVLEIRIHQTDYQATHLVVSIARKNFCEVYERIIIKDDFLDKYTFSCDGSLLYDNQNISDIVSEVCDRYDSEQSEKKIQEEQRLKERDFRRKKQEEEAQFLEIKRQEELLQKQREEEESNRRRIEEEEKKARYQNELEERKRKKIEQEIDKYIHMKELDLTSVDIMNTDGYKKALEYKYLTGNERNRDEIANGVEKYYDAIISVASVIDQEDRIINVDGARWFRCKKCNRLIKMFYGNYYSVGSYKNRPLNSGICRACGLFY